MNKIINIVSNSFDSTQDKTEGDVIFSLYVGNLIGKKDYKKDRKIFYNKYINRRGSKLAVPTYHCFGSDDQTLLNICRKNIEDYYVFDNIDFNHIVKGYKIIGFSRFYKPNLISSRDFNDLKIDGVVKKNKSCDILVFNNMVVNGVVQFPQSLYDAIGKLKPLLVIFGSCAITKVFKFPLFETKSIMLGRDSHVLYDLTSENLYRKIN